MGESKGFTCTVRHCSAIEKGVTTPLAATESTAEVIVLSEEEGQGKTEVT